MSDYETTPPALTAPAMRRRRQALIAAGAALALLLAGAAALWLDMASGAPPSASGPVAPGWASSAGRADLIEVITAGDQFIMQRTDAGWVMPSRGGHPVRPERIAALDEALGGLSFARALTRDPARFARLGVDDPLEGGAGVRLSVLDEDGRTLVSLIAGERRGEDGLYLRPSGAARAFAVRGVLPDLADPGRWLGLDFWDHDPAVMAEASIQPETGPAYGLKRSGPAERHHALTAPEGWRLITAGAGNGVANASARLRFRDVRPEQDLTGAFTARHAASTFDGLAWRFDFLAEGEARWARIEVRALDPEGEARAEALNARTRGWAFLVSPDAYERLTRPLAELAEPAGD
ncbi:DUF4340 domain-containing protein [Alkalicaulis satelles]|uniref:DUF4340 domain-containing protein n=1 Tax=Alkalicaulis satelles TaxID=2609175 RepID=A0A5M6ZFX7_9PROT|nr:DUF4340 domain-containing protein [Alkalicaulis satelles]KAA5803656.1 DUF4340 domain-containing protein [Alkalicaulis satelles]